MAEPQKKSMLLVAGLAVVVAGLAAMVVIQQMRMSRLEEAARPRQAARAAGDDEQRAGGSPGAAWNSDSRPEWRPRTGRFGNDAPGGGGGGAPPMTAAQRLSLAPARPVSTAPAVSDFVQRNQIDQGTWDELVRANKEWVDTLVQAQSRGATSLNGALPELAKRHDEKMHQLVDDKTLADFQKLQSGLEGPRAKVKFGDQIYDGIRVE